MQFARALHRFELALQLDDALADQAAVGLDLGFAGTAEKAETTALPLQVGPRPNQARALIGQRCQFDLQSTFLGPGTSAENLQDQTGPVDDLSAPGLFEVALLYRGKSGIDDGETDLALFDERP